MFEQSVDVLHLQAASGGYPLFPGIIEDFRVVPLVRGHGQDNGLGAGQLLFVHLSALQGFAAGSGDHGRDVGHTAHILELKQLVVKICQRQFAGTHFLLQLLGLFFIETLLGLFNQAQHVAHAQQTGGHAVRVKGFDGV